MKIDSLLAGSIVDSGNTAADKAGASMEGFEIAGPSFVVTGSSDEEMERAITATCQQIAFYGSTPAGGR